MVKRYRLAQILELKKQLEQQQMLALARAEKARQAQEERLCHLVAGVEEQIEVCVPPHLLEHRCMYFVCKHDEVKSAQGHLGTLTEVREDARLELLAAAIERRKLEIHHDQYMATLRYEMQSREQQHADEVGAQMYLRQRVVAR